MKAIILAAGMGTRLGKYTQDLPKCMLNFKGQSLISRQIQTLRQARISDITVVRGYMPHAIALPNIKYSLNAHYGSTNMVETLFCAEQELEGEILICYADIVYEPRVLEAIIASHVDIGITVDVDYLPYWQARLDNWELDVESLMISENGQISELGVPNCLLDRARVRYVGLIKLSSKGAGIFKQVYHKNRERYFHKDEPWLNSKSFKKGYMTDMIQSIINEGYTVHPIPIKRGWMEFDSVEDYEKAIEWDKSGKLTEFVNL